MHRQTDANARRALDSREFMSDHGSVFHLNFFVRSFSFAEIVRQKRAATSVCRVLFNAILPALASPRSLIA